MKGVLAQFIRHRAALVSLVRTDLKQRYSDIVAGLFWSVVQPLLLILLYTFVFSVVLRVKIGGSTNHLNYGIFLFSGMLPWMVIQESVSRATSVFFEQRDVLRHVRLPTYIIPIFPVLTSFLHHMLGLLVFLVLIAFFGYIISGWIALLLPAFVALFMFTGAMSVMVAGLNVYWRDAGPLAQSFLWILFFATPIVYPLDIVPVRWRWVLEVNPLTHLVELYRSALLGIAPPASWKVAYLFGWAALSVAAASWTFSRLNRDLADYI